MDREEFIRSLGEASSYVQFLSEMCTMLSRQNYEYLYSDNQKFASLLREGETSKAMEIYWFEILQRVHFGAVAGLLRQQKWLEGIINSSINSNFICFSSCFRGLIESAGDTHDVFQYVPLTLADCFSYVSQALNSKLEELVINEALEDKLIHFSHARRVEKGETTPDSHRAETSKHYVEAMGSTQLVKCYSELCQVVHPASSSVNCFFIQKSNGKWACTNENDELLIKDFIRRYTSVFSIIFMLPVNSCVLTLQLLNQFDCRSIKTPIPPWVDMTSIPAWQKIQKAIQKAKAG